MRNLHTWLWEYLSSVCVIGSFFQAFEKIYRLTSEDIKSPDIVAYRVILRPKVTQATQMIVMSQSLFVLAIFRFIFFSTAVTVPLFGTRCLQGKDKRKKTN